MVITINEFIELLQEENVNQELHIRMLPEKLGYIIEEIIYPLERYFGQKIRESKGPVNEVIYDG